jgi:hypothetical protein
MTHQVEIVRQEHGAVRAKRYRAECSCGWIGGVCDHPKTAEADGVDHLRDTVECTCPDRLIDSVRRTVGHPYIMCPFYGQTTPLDVS